MNDIFGEQQKEVLNFLKILNDNGVLNHVIIAGSWAEYIYAQAGVLPGFDATLRTIDMDFLVKNMRRPAEPISIPAIAKKHGYSIEYDVLMGTTKIFSPGGLEIEFLIGQMGSGVNPILKTNLGVNAQALRHMEHIVCNAITVDLLGMNVQVPCPESYVLHKMLINDVRTPQKKIKDRASISRLLPHIDFKKAGELYGQMTKKEKARIQKFIKAYGEEVSAELRLDDKIRFMDFVKETFPNISQSELQIMFHSADNRNQ